MIGLRLSMAMSVASLRLKKIEDNSRVKRVYVVIQGSMRIEFLTIGDGHADWQEFCFGEGWSCR